MTNAVSIHVDRVHLLIARAWGMQRVTNRVQERLSSLVNQASVIRRGDYLISRQADFSAVDYFRISIADPEEAIPFEHVAPVEIAACVRAVLKEQFGLPIADLEREVVRVFGLQRTSATARKRVGEIVEQMVISGQCFRDGDTIRADG